MSKEKIKWHPAFAATVQLELKEYKEYLEYLTEFQLSDEPLKIDIVVIKKLKDIKIDKAIGRIFKKYNVFEYKSPTDYISIDDYYKVKAYAYLYKALAEGENSVDIDELTITFTSTTYPRKLFEYLTNEKGLNLKAIFPGMYYLKGSDIETQFLIIKDLPKKEKSYLKLLQREQKDKELIKEWIYEYLENNKNPLYGVIMDVVTESNLDILVEVYKEMGVAKISEANKAFLMDAIKKLELDKKLKEEGIEEVVRNFLKLGVGTEIVIKATGLSEKRIAEIKKELE